MPAFNAAEKLAVLGLRTTLVTPTPGIGARIPHESLAPLLRRLDEAGVALLPGHRLVPDGDGVRAVAVVGGEARCLPADVLVWNAGRRVQDDLHRLGRRQLDLPMHVIGDAVSPRRISHAILEGYRAGAAV